LKGQGGGRGVFTTEIFKILQYVQGGADATRGDIKKQMNGEMSSSGVKSARRHRGKGLGVGCERFGDGSIFKEPLTRSAQMQKKKERARNRSESQKKRPSTKN